MVVLGLLAEHGPMHGHQLRRRADSMHVESWGGVTPGALYRELHLLEAEGLIELVRSEQVGRRPPRAVYRIARAGQAALRILSEEALTVYSRPPDIVGVGLLFGALEGPGERSRPVGEPTCGRWSRLSTPSWSREPASRRPTG